MAQSIRTFRSRRLTASFLTLTIAVVIALGLWACALALHDTAYNTGWALLGMVLFLAAYNLRKKLTYPPLLRSATWLQLHIYTALLSVVVFGFHVGFRLPNGVVEASLASLYLLTVLSGVLGLALTRTIPKRLAVRGPEVLFERIPIFRRELRVRAEDLAVGSVEQTNATTLADFYTERLADYFSGPRHVGRHLLQSRRPLHRITNELTALDRYLNADERAVAADLADLIDAKDALDYHYAMQGALKVWLFIHIPLTYMLIAVAVVHLFLIHAFLG